MTETRNINTLESNPFPEEMTDEKLSEELEKGYEDMLKGRVKSAKEIFAKIREDHGL